jgi:hypothetical protein
LFIELLQDLIIFVFGFFFFRFFFSESFFKSFFEDTFLTTFLVFCFNKADDWEVFFEHDEELDYEDFDDKRYYYSYLRNQNYLYSKGQFEDEDFFDLDLNLNLQYRYNVSVLLADNGKIDKKKNPLLYLRDRKTRKAFYVWNRYSKSLWFSLSKGVKRKRLHSKTRKKNPKILFQRQRKRFILEFLALFMYSDFYFSFRVLPFFDEDDYYDFWGEIIYYENFVEEDFIIFINYGLFFIFIFTIFPFIYETFSFFSS